MATVDDLKQAAAAAAAELAEDGMVLGLGSGTTAMAMVKILGRRVAEGLRITGVPTSAKTRALAASLAIPLSTLDEQRHIDLTIDGADEVTRGSLDLVKGRGGALLYEKLIAVSSRRFAIIVDESKMVDRLCPERQPIPVEVVPFGWQSTAQRLTSLGAEWTLRSDAEGQPAMTDGGHYTLDCRFPLFDSAADLQAQIDGVVGVVEHGLFLGMATEVIVARPGGVERSLCSRVLA
ncbi:MAG TPA: ribose 5-phosphate isomerase A [Candidatus Sulfopaludibacter sp.]|jgi:ribose 5-phosphate isomerase A|nr:ribose 5-phosphate isomerase A [Candidatus Sulfopaludibacter sp.]